MDLTLFGAPVLRIREDGTDPEFLMGGTWEAEAGREVAWVTVLHAHLKARSAQIAMEACMCAPEWASVSALGRGHNRG